MPCNPQPATIDPLHVFTAGAFLRDTRRPVPLIATTFDVEIEAGLAAVHTKRIFRNAEASSIEATITFPVPVHATLFSLSARIGERTLTARAERNKAARQFYEGAIDQGKTAVLHEEVLRGVHILSIGHIPAGAEIEVSTRWALSLTWAGRSSTLCIPLTVGDIYGRSALTDADDLVHRGPLQSGTLTVRCLDGKAMLRGMGAMEEQVAVPLNAPINIEISGWRPKELCGQAADGRYAVLCIEPSPETQAPLSTAVVVDHSGSMTETCAMIGAGQVSKHRAVIAGLEAAAGALREGDVVSLWEFGDQASFIGEARGGGKPVQERFRSLLRQLHAPQGGTQIGAALRTVIAASSARDILVITDGKSHDLDVHALARQGCRVQLVLVGDDSLEANVGHLAALTGGEAFVAAGGDLEPAIAAAMASLRAPHEPLEPARALPETVNARRSGMRITARWRDRLLEAGSQTVLDGRAIAAFAASLALPALPEKMAARLAQSEGLVTHLTSFVLVDEAGARQEGIPATRKVALPTPSGAYHPESRINRSSRSGPLFALGGEFAAAREPLKRRLPSRKPATEKSQGDGGLAQLAARLPWHLAPQRLQAGDLSDLPPQDASVIMQAAAKPGLAEVAAGLGIAPVVLVIALLALTLGPTNRTAARIARSILGKAPPADARTAAAALGLDAAI
ncbi:MAG: VIT domain-containing protein [Rhodomicrobium sp.]